MFDVEVVEFGSGDGTGPVVVGELEQLLVDIWDFALDDSAVPLGPGPRVPVALFRLLDVFFGHLVMLKLGHVVLVLEEIANLSGVLAPLVLVDKPDLVFHHPESELEWCYEAISILIGHEHDYLVFRRNFVNVKAAISVFVGLFRVLRIFKGHLHRDDRRAVALELSISVVVTIFVADQLKVLAIVVEGQ